MWVGVGNDDIELLDQWIGGDEDAGDALVQRHLPAIHRFFHAKAPKHADDLVQATFLACVEARSRFARNSTFRAYLFGIARNLLFAHIRSKRGALELDFSITSMRDIDPSPSSMLARSDRGAVVAEALRQLSVERQLLLELYYWEGLSTHEIAEALDVARGTVKSRLHRARNDLGQRLTELAPGLADAIIEDLRERARGPE